MKSFYPFLLNQDWKSFFLKFLMLLSDNILRVLKTVIISSLKVIEGAALFMNII
ncbi:hypothetical protein Rh054_02390 [Rickettsia conorii subsp. heilongjiangensis 054]|nr:hypothetical protein Rh054_02390 [Rickettsia conorii subsp. heilongjiangensis 054]